MTALLEAPQTVQAPQHYTTYALGSAHQIFNHLGGLVGYVNMPQKGETEFSALVLRSVDTGLSYFCSGFASRDDAIQWVLVGGPVLPLSNFKGICTHCEQNPAHPDNADGLCQDCENDYWDMRYQMSDHF